MRPRTLHLVALVAALLAMGTAAPLASPAPVVAAHPTSTAFCPIDTRSRQGAGDRSTRNRIAFKCRCCGRDENGHCNHQCCD